MRSLPQYGQKTLPSSYSWRVRILVKDFSQTSQKYSYWGMEHLPDARILGLFAIAIQRQPCADLRPSPKMNSKLGDCVIEITQSPNSLLVGFGEVDRGLGVFPRHLQHAGLRPL